VFEETQQAAPLLMGSPLFLHVLLQKYVTHHIKSRCKARVRRRPLCAQYMDDCITSLRMEVLAQTISLTPPHIIEVLLSRQKSKRLCICVLGVSILLYWISNLFGQYNIFCFPFYCEQKFVGSCRNCHFLSFACGNQSSSSPPHACTGMISE
jgi:hypothetical protein